MEDGLRSLEGALAAEGSAIDFCPVLWLRWPQEVYGLARFPLHEQGVPRGPVRCQSTEVGGQAQDQQVADQGRQRKATNPKT